MVNNGQNTLKGVLSAKPPIFGRKVSVLRGTRGSCALTRVKSVKMTDKPASKPVVLEVIPEVQPVTIVPRIVNALVQPGESMGVETPIWTNAEYHARNDSISSSTLKKILRSSAHMKAYWDEPNKETNARLIGNALHSMVLEPAEFPKNFVVWHGGDRRGKKYDEFLEANQGMSVLKPDEYRDVAGMRNAIMAYEEYPIGDLIESGKNEFTIVWVDRETGVRCKVRADNLNPYGILDLKSTSDSRPPAFIRLQCVPLDYDLHAYMYREGVYQLTGEWRDFYFIAVENSAPYSVWVHQASATMLESGKQKFRRGLELYAKSMKTLQFPGYEVPCSIIEWPHYASY